MLNPFANIRPAERRETWTAFLLLFGMLAAHALAETARDALFLASIPASRLAWVYLAIAGASLLFFFALNAGGRGQGHRSRLVGWLVGAAVVYGGFWFLAERSEAWVFYALYVWTGVFATLVLVRFWTLLGDLFTVGQAKRVFAFIGLGGVLGAIVGSALAGGLAAWVGARHILLAAAAVLVATGAGALISLPSEAGRMPSDGSARPGLRASDLLTPFRISWERPYLRRVGAVVLLSTVAFTLVDFIFKSAVAGHFPAERLGSVFALSYLSLNLASLGAQLFLVNLLMRTWGLNRVLSILPGLFLVGAAAVAAGGGLIAALALKLFDGTLRHSLHRTASEVLYVPLSGDLRSRMKGFIDTVGQRGGQAVASLFILGASAVTGTEHLLAGLVVVLAAVWIRIAAGLRVHYLNLFRETLSEVALDTRIDFPEFDLASLESLMAGLNSSSDAEVVAALDLLGEQQRVRLIPALILYHPSSAVVIRALELFSDAGRLDFVPITERLLEREDPEVRAATLRTLAWIAPDAEVYRRFVDDPSPIVRATALIGLISYGSVSWEEGEERMLRTAGDGRLPERLALARAIRYSPGAAYEGILLLLAEGKDASVQLEVARAMAEIRSPHFIPKLLEMLPNRTLRGQARRTLTAVGESALEHLEEALAAPHLNVKIRRQIPRAIAQFDPVRAAAILGRRLADESDGGVRFRVLKALTRLRRDDPTLPLETAVLERAADGTIRAAFRLVNWILLLDEAAEGDPVRRTQASEMIRLLLEHKRHQAMERLFELLGLLHPAEDLGSVLRGLRSNNRKLRASGIELLENLLASPRRDAVLALVDDMSPEEQLARAGTYHRRMRMDYESLLRQLLERPGVGMRSLVVYHIGELRIHALRETLEHLPSDLSGLVSSGVERTLKLLDAPETADGT